MIQFDFRIFFQNGWFNHQLVRVKDGFFFHGILWVRDCCFSWGDKARDANELVASKRSTKKRFRRLRKDSNAVAASGNLIIFRPKMGRWSHFDYMYIYIYTYLFFFSDGWLIEAPTVVWFCSCQSEVWRMHQDEQEEQVGHKPSGPPQKKTNPAALGCFSVLKMDWIIANRNKNNHEIVHDSHIFLKPFDAWSHLPLFLVGLSKGCTSPICQGDASRIGSIYGPLLLGEVVEKSSISILVKQTTWYEGNSKYMEFPRVKPGKTQR